MHNAITALCYHHTTSTGDHRGTRPRRPTRCSPSLSSPYPGVNQKPAQRTPSSATRTRGTPTRRIVPVHPTPLRSPSYPGVDCPAARHQHWSPPRVTFTVHHTPHPRNPCRLHSSCILQTLPRSPPYPRVDHHPAAGERSPVNLTRLNPPPPAAPLPGLRLSTRGTHQMHTPYRGEFITPRTRRTRHPRNPPAPTPTAARGTRTTNPRRMPPFSLTPPVDHRPAALEPHP